MSRTRTTTNELHIPRQRSLRHAVLLVLTPDEPLDAVVRFAAQAASQQQGPLAIAMLTAGTHVGASCMAALDTALQLAKAVAPHLLVRVDTLAPRSVGAPLTDLHVDSLVVASPQTWSRLPDYARIERAADAAVRLIEPAT